MGLGQPVDPPTASVRQGPHGQWCEDKTCLPDTAPLPQPPPLSRGSTARFYPPTFWLEPDTAQASERHTSAKRDHIAVL